MAAGSGNGVCLTALDGLVKGFMAAERMPEVRGPSAPALHNPSVCSCTSNARASWMTITIF